MLINAARSLISRQKCGSYLKIQRRQLHALYIVPIFHMCNPPDVLDTSEGQNNLFSVKVIELRSNNKVKKY